MLIRCPKFEEGKIVWGLKFEGPKHSHLGSDI